MMYAACGSAGEEIAPETLEGLVGEALRRVKGARRIIAVPPDISRAHSRAGEITDIAYRILGGRLSAVLPALGSHAPMSASELGAMYPGTPAGLFRVHDWRRDTVELGRIPASFVSEVGEGLVNYDYPVQVNRLLASGDFDAILSVGQVVPHEVTGMANHAKNIFVGTGGKEAIDKSHFLGASFGIERIMGRTNTPVRRLFNRALELAAGKLPSILWMLTVMGRDSAGRLVMRGFYAGDDIECFERAASLSRRVNIDQMDKSIKKAVVWMDPAEYRSTWVGNKAIHRTRMAMADGGELIILAPGLAQCGEDAGLDALIRKYGYRSSAEIRELVSRNEDLAASLSAAAHLIHGSSDGRFKVTYAPGPGMSRGEIESIGFNYAPLEEMLNRYSPSTLKEGWNESPDGEQVFFISNPSTGLWSTRERFGSEMPA